MTSNPSVHRSGGRADGRVPGRRGGSPGALVVAVLATLAVLALIGVAAVQSSSGSHRGTGAGWLPWASACWVETENGEIRLSREEAQRATTAVALATSGVDSDSAVDTADLDPAVLQRLAKGPHDDAGPSLSCRGEASEDLEVQEITASGLTPRAEAVRTAMAQVFGELPLGGFAPGGVDTGHQEGSTHYEGRALDVFYRPVTEENRREGWLLAHWLIAHADQLDVQYVIFDDRVWGARSSRGGWSDYRSPDPDNEVLRHLDHVHVDVLRGADP